jgi:thiol-disulfide isomerase/thioredoxin
MKKILVALAFVVSALSASAQYSNQKINLGQKAPELDFPMPSGEKLKLSEVYKNRVVLVDFWASWCRPCRGANPRLVAMYDEYKEKKFKNAKKGFTILSVSLDQNKDSWVKAIADDKLTWPYHMSDLGAWGSQAAELYGIQYIPQAFLVGPDGKILGKYNFAEEAKADLDKMLKSN